MARRVSSFDEGQTVRRYPWDEWTDGSIWEIKQKDDYDVPTENMRVNLHERAKQIGMKVKTQIVRSAPWNEGLRFQFYMPDAPPAHGRHPVGDPRNF
jgi:hypothetical protein